MLLLGLLFKSTAKLRRELEAYTSGYNADLARDRLEARYDGRFAAALLLLGFALQIVSLALDGNGGRSGWALAVEALAVTVTSLVAWWIPRRATVSHDQACLERQITAEWAAGKAARESQQGATKLP